MGWEPLLKSVVCWEVVQPCPCLWVVWAHCLNGLKKQEGGACLPTMGVSSAHCLSHPALPKKHSLPEKKRREAKVGWEGLGNVCFGRCSAQQSAKSP